MGFCDGERWRWCRFSPRTAVSPAKLYSICFSTIIFTITRGWHNRARVIYSLTNQIKKNSYQTRALFCKAIGTAGTSGLLCQPRVIVKMIVEKQMECRLAGETEVLGENLPQRHLSPSQNPIWQQQGWTRAAAVGSRRLTAWAMARPWRGPFPSTSFQFTVN
jgi:hypothetical protein